MKCNTLVREEEVQMFPFHSIGSVKSRDGRVLGSNRKIREAFRACFRDRFAPCPDLPVQEFRSYLTDFPRIRGAEAASCEGVVLTQVLANRLQLDISDLIRPEQNYAMKGRLI